MFLPVFKYLTRFSHQYSAADADKLAVAGCAPCSRFDVVSTQPAPEPDPGTAPSSSPRSPPQRHLDTLGNCSDTSDRCIALLLHIHVHIATNTGEKCGLAPGLVRRFCPRLAKIAGLAIWLGLLAPVVGADEGDPFEIQSASFSLDNTLLKLDLKIRIDLPEFVGIAVNQGFAVPLMFEVEIFTSRNYWFDKRVVTLQQSYQLHFLPMLSSYVVNDVNAGKRHYFDSLDEAVEFMEVVYNYPMLDISNFDFNREFYARTRFRIDNDELPLPLKPSVFWPSNWDERSNWYSFEMIPLNPGLSG